MTQTPNSGKPSSPLKVRLAAAVYGYIWDAVDTREEGTLELVLHDYKPLVKMFIWEIAHHHRMGRLWQETKR